MMTPNDLLQAAQHDGLLAFSDALWVLNASERQKIGAHFEAHGTALALDVLANPTLLTDDGLFELELASGELTAVADTLEQWAERIIKSPGRYAGAQIAAKWCAQNGPLPGGHRLVPIQPISFGGDYRVANLVAMPVDEAISTRTDRAKLFELPPKWSMNVT